MSTPGINKNYFYSYSPNEKFKVVLSHRASDDAFYIYGLSDGKMFVSKVGDIHSARGVWNKITKEFRRLDKSQREVAASIRKIISEYSAIV